MALSKQSTEKTHVRSHIDDETDVIDLILEHHKPLKRLIKIMKDPENDLSERKAAFDEFGPLLIAHAKPEEQVLYTEMKDSSEDDLRVEGIEGGIEHWLAEQMLKDAKQTRDDDEWTAKVKILDELVEHHIKEEEKELLPDFKKNSKSSERHQLGREYLEARRNYEVDDIN